MASYPRTIPPLNPQYVTRFWQRVRVVDDADSCWLWTGWTKNGYGSLRIFAKVYLAHRVMWMLHYGDTSLDVLHKCDNPPCVRPSHLFLGTNADNVEDKMRKGRYRSHNMKLTADDVRTIRQQHQPERWGSMAELQRRYGISSAQIHRIIHRQVWKRA